MTIDAHVHFWQFDPVRDAWISDAMAVLQQDYLPQQLENLFTENGIDGCIAVQADQSETETNFLLALAKEHAFIKGIVGWIDLRSENLPDRLEHFRQFPLIKGWRHIVQAEPIGFLQGSDFRRGIRILGEYSYSYDVLVYHHQLKQALDLINHFPDQRFIIDHCAKPDIAGKQVDDWATYMKEIARHPGVFCKVSGLLTETSWGNWKDEDFYPYLDTVFECFGTGRLLFGSDWPVMLLSGRYAQWRSLLGRYMQGCSETEKKNVFGGNAIRCYDL